MKRLLRPFASRETYRALLYQLGTVALGSVGLALLIAGWTTAIVFAITPLVVVVLIAFGLGLGYLAAAEAYLASALLGLNVRPTLGAKGSGYWMRGLAVLKAREFWQQQAHLLLSGAIAIVALAPFSIGLQTLAILFYYDKVDDTDLFGMRVDTLGDALLAVPTGLALLAVGFYLIGPVTRLSRTLARRLLAAEDTRIRRSAAELSARRRQVLTIISLISASLVLALIVVWWATTPDRYFWPVWPLLSLSLVVGIPGWIVLVRERPKLTRFALGSEALAIQVGVSAILLSFLTGVWAVTTRGYFWPGWPALGLGLLAAVSAAGVYGQREHRIRRLEQTRAGAVDVQESELRRIERDLHDGAQARLVALGMSLGQAEQALETDPDAARKLLSEARQGAREALEELRDLARGIRPPVLTDRGLEPAITALTARTPLAVTLSIRTEGRYPSAVETAAYFTVAEALANAIKHTSAKRIAIDIEAADGVLVVQVVDDGAGGADPSGPGLTGLRQRVEALDGRLTVQSPADGPTTVRAELPCES
jgi:signal transduction histidine kinase